MHRFWKRDKVEGLWAVLHELAPRKATTSYATFWADVAARFNARFGTSITAKAAINKANEVAKAGRPYPWTLKAAAQPFTKVRVIVNGGAPRVFVRTQADGITRLTHESGGEIIIDASPFVAPATDFSEVLADGATFRT